VVFGGRVKDGELLVGRETGVEREREELRGTWVKGAGAFGNGGDSTVNFVAASEED